MVVEYVSPHPWDKLRGFIQEEPDVSKMLVEYQVIRSKIDAVLSQIDDLSMELDSLSAESIRLRDAIETLRTADPVSESFGLIA